MSVIGPGAHDKSGRGNINRGDGGLGFVIATAGSIPGGADTVSTSFEPHILTQDSEEMDLSLLAQECNCHERRWGS